MQVKNFKIKKLQLALSKKDRMKTVALILSVKY